MTTETKGIRKHDAFFRWLFADVNHLKELQELSAKVNQEVYELLSAVNLDTLTRIPDSYSEVDDTGEADLAFRVNVSTGAPVIVGVLVEHKSGRDPDTLNQIARYIHSVMKLHMDNRAFDGIPTMAIIFYNGKANWNPLKNLEDGYPEFFHGAVLPYKCTFVNMTDIPDSDCLACEDVEVGMGITAMKYAFAPDKLLPALFKFKEDLFKLGAETYSCMLRKINIYLKEYLTKQQLKELEMAFVSIGQKYGFVSAGDEFRKELAETHQKAEAEKIETARRMVADKTISLEKAMEYYGLTKDQILP
jgi:hypothetical protein